MCTIYTYVCIVVEFIFISNDVFSHNAKDGLSQGAPWEEFRKKYDTKLFNLVWSNLKYLN